MKRKWVEVEAAENAKCTVVLVYSAAESASRVRHGSQQVKFVSSGPVVSTVMIGNITEIAALSSACAENLAAKTM